MAQAARKFSALPAQARVIWAKSGDEGGHGLLAHMLDVAAVVETVLECEPPSTLNWAARQFGLPLPYVARWMAAVAGLHDFGKAIPGFQAKWEEGKRVDQKQGLLFTSPACEVTNHSCATAALLKNAFKSVVDLHFDWRQHVVQAISAHHGYHFTGSEVEKARPIREPANWAEARQHILEVYWAVLSPKDLPLLEGLSTPAMNWLAGLTSFADWVASNPDWFPLGERLDDLHAYHQHARQLAAQALQQIRWPAWSVMQEGDGTTDGLLGRIVGLKHGLQSRPLQSAGDHLLQGARGPTLMLVEAPMGEGKTELAFLAYLRLQATNQHRGLYVAMPTQATGNAMLERATRFLAAFARDITDIQLVHGGAAMNEAVRRLREVDHSSNESLSVSAWFAQRRRPLLSPYGVGTVDQALFATLNVKHHFVRLWGFANRVVVLDEVHAYDTYTSGLIESMLKWLKALGSSVILMSATLPTARRSALLRAWGVESTDVPELPYPRVLLADDTGLRGDTFPARPLPTIRLLGLPESLDEMARCAEAMLEDGGCGAVIVNTVDRAQKLYIAMQDRLGESTRLQLFHARFPADQRSELEREVLDLFGPRGNRPSQALLIATQVVEQSLDLDFDFMISDLAPVDLLLQRAGRLHRHTRARPGRHKEACLHVAGLKTPSLPELKKTAWSFVYDAYILGRTWALLSQETLLHLPEDIDRLVQAVYGAEPLPDELESRARDFIETESYGEYLARVSSERTQADNIAIDPNDAPHNAYANKPKGNEEGDGLGLTNRTRLGEDSITVVPLLASEEGWRVRRNGLVFRPNASIDDVTARQLYARQIRLSRKAVVNHFRSSELPASFAEHPLLCNMYPLPLHDGVYEADGLRLRLDENLGLVMENQEKEDGQGACAS